MKDNWNELFDSMKEEDILRNLPEDLPEMEEELAAKRIENRVMQELQIDMGLQKNRRRKRILAAAVCVIAVVGIFGHRPIMAAFERLFHDLPGVGVYINEEDVKVYEVQIDDPVQEQGGIRVELRDFYCEGNLLHGTFVFTGEGLEKMEFDEEDESIDIDEILKEKFQITYYFGDSERKMFAPRFGYTRKSGKIMEHTRTCEEYIPIKQGYFVYEIKITGFDRSFHLKLVEPKTVETPEELGYSQTKNDTTVTARASIVDDMIEMEYFIIPSDEVKLAQDEWNVLQVPYQFDWENQYYFENAAGERMQYERFREIANGRKFWFEGSEEDFPVKFHLPTLTGTNTESYTIDLALPEDGKRITENLPKLEFQYGTVEILSIARENGEYDNQDEINPEISSAAIVDIIYRVTPKDGLRQMYRVDLEIEEEWGEIYGGEGLETGKDYFVDGGRYYLADLEKESLKVKFHLPSFWIKGDYDIIIEKPVYQEDAASSIDQEEKSAPKGFRMELH